MPILIFLIMWLLFGNLSYAMDKNLEDDDETFIPYVVTATMANTVAKKQLPEDWLKSCILRALDARYTDKNSNLQQKSFGFIVKQLLSTKGSLADLDTLKIPVQIAESFKKWFNRLFAVEWFRWCGSGYRPTIINLTKLHTMMSADRKYFCEYDDASTIIYKMNDIYPERLLEIDGSLLSMSLDCRYLLLKYSEGLCFYDLLHERTVCIYKGPYEVNRDFLIFNPIDKSCVPTSCITFVRGQHSAFKNRYTIATQTHLEELLLAHENAYLFTIHGLGLPMRCLACGKHSNEFNAYVLPNRFKCDASGEITVLFLDLESRYGHILHASTRASKINLVQPWEGISCFDYVRDKHKIVFATDRHMYESTIEDDTEEISLSKGNYRLGPTNAIMHLTVSPDYTYAITVDDFSEFLEGISTDATVKLHSLMGHNFDAEHNDNCCEIIASVGMGHVGFSSDGFKFFLCTNSRFMVFDLAAFAPDLPYAQWEKVLAVIRLCEDVSQFSAFHKDQSERVGLGLLNSISDSDLKEKLRSRLEYLLSSEYQEKKKISVLKI